MKIQKGQNESSKSISTANKISENDLKKLWEKFKGWSAAEFLDFIAIADSNPYYSSEGINFFSLRNLDSTIMQLSLYPIRDSQNESIRNSDLLNFENDDIQFLESTTNNKFPGNYPYGDVFNEHTINDKMIRYYLPEFLEFSIQEEGYFLRVNLNEDLSIRSMKNYQLGEYKVHDLDESCCEIDLSCNTYTDTFKFYPHIRIPHGKYKELLIVFVFDGHEFLHLVDFKFPYDANMNFHLA